MDENTVVKMTAGELEAHVKAANEKAIEAFAKKQTGGVAPLFNIGGSKAKGYDVETVEGRGVAIARGLRAMAIAKNDPSKAAEIVKDWQ